MTFFFFFLVVLIVSGKLEEGTDLARKVANCLILIVKGERVLHLCIIFKGSYFSSFT